MALQCILFTSLKQSVHVLTNPVNIIISYELLNTHKLSIKGHIILG